MFDKFPEIPPRFFWPGMVVGILGISFTANIVLVMAAQSDGGPEVVPEYYEKAVAWDEQKALEAASARLGWSVTYDVVGEASKERPVELSIYDRAGEPVTGIEGTFALHHPMKAEAIATDDVTPIAGEPGRYRVEVPVTRRGLWDFVVDLRRGDDVYVSKTRQEVGK